MKEAKSILGMMFALGFLCFGMRVLPRPGLGAVENIFTMCWLGLIWLCLAAFVRETWRVARLRTVHRSFRGRRRTTALLQDETAAFNRQRERRLD